MHCVSCSLDDLNFFLLLKASLKNTNRVIRESYLVILIKPMRGYILRINKISFRLIINTAANKQSFPIWAKVLRNRMLSKINRNSS